MRTFTTCVPRGYLKEEVHVKEVAKHKGKAIVVLSMMLLLVAAPQVMASSVYINGVPLVTSNPPVTMQGSMLLPMRDVFEALDAEVKWFAAERKIMAIRGQTTIELWLGTPVATVNSRPIQLPVPPTLIGAVTYVPLRFPAEAFGGNVTWDSAARAAMIEIPEVGADVAVPVTPPAPPVIPAPDPEPQVVTPEPPQPTRLEGSLQRVYPGAHPAVLVHDDASGSSRMVQLDPQTQIARGMVGAPASATTLEQVRAGDQVVIVISPEGKTLELTATYQSKESTVVAVAANNMMLEDGTVMKLAEIVRIHDTAGNEATIGALTQGTKVTLTYNPNSQEVYEIVVPQAPVAPAPEEPEKDPEILTLGLVDSSGYVKAGDRITIAMQATAGGRATVQIEGFEREIVLNEVQPGQYENIYTVRRGNQISNARMLGRLTVGDKSAEPTPGRTTITVDNTPPVLQRMLPRHRAEVETDSPMIKIDYEDPGPVASGIDLSTVRLVVNGQDMTAYADVAPARVSLNTQGLKPGVVNVEATVRDRSGNEAVNRWLFTVKPPPEPIILAVWHNVERPLVTGDQIVVHMRVAEIGGKATFSIAGVAENVPMNRAGQTMAYRGVYTVKAGDNVEDAVITGHYTDPHNKTATMEATVPLTINTALPSELKITAPANGSKAADNIVISGEAPPNQVVQVTITYHAQLIARLTGQLWRGNVQVDETGK